MNPEQQHHYRNADEEAGGSFRTLKCKALLKVLRSVISTGSYPLFNRLASSSNLYSMHSFFGSKQFRGIGLAPDSEGTTFLDRSITLALNCDSNLRRVLTLDFCETHKAVGPSQSSNFASRDL